MKKMYLKFLAALVVVVMLSAISIGDIPEAVDMTRTVDTTSRAIPSAVVWSDNFDDEDVSDWELFVVNHTVSPDTLHPGMASAEGGVLRHHGPEWSYVGHNSSVAFGTWSFDLDIQLPVEEAHYTVLFSSEVFNDDWLTRETVGEAYGVSIYMYPTHDDISLLKTSHEPDGHVYIDDYSNATLSGWNNVIVTRELSGLFYVYLNEELILSGINLVHTTSERFYFLSHGGPAIDNVTVSDTIDFDAAPPEWVEDPSDQRINPGTPFDYDLNATDYSGIDQWWINDTQNFAIDVNGVISNIEVLNEGLYNIDVSVNDTLGNTRSGSFRLIVASPPTGFPTELVVGSTGIAAIVIIVLVIWRKKG